MLAFCQVNVLKEHDDDMTMMMMMTHVELRWPALLTRAVLLTVSIYTRCY